ncbi:MAG TPA: hypothetical protein VMB79_00200 [Jatrophihabitans sp.]|nr:hypothetical protein [Jatrophihabitans sp.]
MTSTDPRAVAEYRIPAPSLRAGDLINTSPGADEDWQQVLSVHTQEDPGAGTDPHAAALVGEIGDRYVVVRMTDVAPVDAPVYFAGGVALAYGMDGADDSPVAEVLTEAGSVRTFVYTRFELVTVRAR